MSKLTERQKKNIVSAYAAGSVSYSDLAAKYRVSNATFFGTITEGKILLIKTGLRSTPKE